VVGSGGSLWRSGLGREIDSHDVVLRVNQAPTVGYERHVGRRTHVRMLNNRWSMKYSHDRQSPSAVRAVSLFPVGRQPSNRCTPHRVRRPSHTLFLGSPCSRQLYGGCLPSGLPRQRMRECAGIVVTRVQAKVSASMPLEEGVMALLTRADEEDYRRLHSHLATTRPDVRMRLLSSRVISTVRDRMLVRATYPCTPTPALSHHQANDGPMSPPCHVEPGVRFGSPQVPYRTKLNATCEEPLLWSVAEGRDTPSSGLVAVALLLQLCEGVAVYGFSGTNDGKRYHYFKGNRNYMNRTHSFSAERALLRALARDGRIQFVEGNTEFVTGGV